MCPSGAVVNCSDCSYLKCWSHGFNSGWVHFYFRFFLGIHLPVCVCDVSLAFKKITLIIQGCNRHWSKLPTYELGALKPLDIYVPLSASKISKTSKLEVLGVLGENCICWCTYISGPYYLSGTRLSRSSLVLILYLNPQKFHVQIPCAV